MASDFIIKKGRSTLLFDQQGLCRIPQAKLIEYGWYLTTDTAEIYVAVRNNETNQLELKKLNEFTTNPPEFTSLEERLSAVEDFVNDLREEVTIIDGGSSK